MGTNRIVDAYYAAWQDHAGDMSGVPLAADFTFTGPVASFIDAAGFRAMAIQAGAAVRSFRVRHQFADGDLVCSVVDWEMDPLPGVLTAAEILHLRDGEIIRGELIYDAEDLRRALAPAAQHRTNMIEINASPETVWAVLGDLAATPNWLPEPSPLASTARPASALWPTDRRSTNGSAATPRRPARTTGGTCGCRCPCGNRRARSPSRQTTPNHVR